MRFYSCDSSQSKGYLFASFVHYSKGPIELARLLAYIRTSVVSHLSYVADSNLCQYGHGICGLRFAIWRVGLMWNWSKDSTGGSFRHGKSQKLTSPMMVKCVYTQLHQRYQEHHDRALQRCYAVEDYMAMSD